VLAAEPERPGRVRALARRLRAGLGPLQAGGRPDVPIVPVVAGDAARATALEVRLLEAGYLAQAVRPPTVAPGTSRLRLVPTAAHTEAEVDGAAAAVLAALESGP
jgi:8-amino-7-oxononanoate synthase